MYKIKNVEELKKNLNESKNVLELLNKNIDKRFKIIEELEKIPENTEKYKSKFLELIDSINKYALLDGRRCGLSFDAITIIFRH
ncbi:hypothetical protein LCGC14_1188800 [marine sediment metagenome]|uniref:Uncharacterized protein n=1 Tax=marine sediment metagenome TaxID=412755 RepID=A0A0F9M7R8_9ZZZZ